MNPVLRIFCATLLVYFCNVLFTVLMIQYSSLLTGWHACCCAGKNCFPASGFSWAELSEGCSAGFEPVTALQQPGAQTTYPQRTLTATPHKSYSPKVGFNLGQKETDRKKHLRYPGSMFCDFSSSWIRRSRRSCTAGPLPAPLRTFLIRQSRGNS